jgi:hypothetical protein
MMLLQKIQSAAGRMGLSFERLGQLLHVRFQDICMVISATCIAPSHPRSIVQPSRLVIRSLVILLLPAFALQAQYTGGSGSGSAMGTTGSTPIALPVELVSFGATLRNDAVHLVWHTATETNNYGFEIQRAERDDWRVIGFVAGHGTKSSATTYRFVDETLPASEGWSYRLRQLDRDGTEEYSPIVHVAASALPAGLRVEAVHPDPARVTAHAVMTLAEPATLTIAVYGSDGRRVLTLADAAQYDAGVHTLIIPRGSLPLGAYYLTVDAPSGRHTRPLRFLP